MPMIVLKKDTKMNKITNGQSQEKQNAYQVSEGTSGVTAPSVQGRGELKRGIVGEEIDKETTNRSE